DLLAPPARRPAARPRYSDLPGGAGVGTEWARARRPRGHQLRSRARDDSAPGHGAGRPHASGPRIHGALNRRTDRTRAASARLVLTASLSAYRALTGHGLCYVDLNDRQPHRIRLTMTQFVLRDGPFGGTVPDDVASATHA